MKVRLIRSAVDADYLCGEAAAICTGTTDALQALRGAMNCGHESIAEHANFTFYIEGVSRVLLAQLTRHRIASFSVESQRYCGVRPEWVVPKSIFDAGLEGTYLNEAQRCYAAYNAMIAAGIEEEDARYIIPQGITCRLMMTMNARELRHFFSLRCCNRAQDEIRELADRMRELCKAAAPQLFARSGAACQRGKRCPEGRKTCGKPRRKEE